VYWTRIRRRISPSPTRIFGAHHLVAMPYIGDDLVRATLAAPLSEKLDGRLIRRVFEIVNPVVGALPSTNDPDLPSPRRDLSRVARSREARALYVSLLKRSPLRPWFSDHLRKGVDRGKLGKRAPTSWLFDRLVSLCSLSLWLDRHRDLIADPDPGTLLGSVPRAGCQAVRG
jgi:hypothetical protein